MKALSLLAALCAVLLSGCATINEIPTEKLAADLSAAAKGALKYGLQAAVRKYPSEAAKITADAKLANEILTKNVIPIFSGAQTADVLRSAVDTALALLKSKLTDARVIAAIDLAVEVIVMEVKLPANPATKLDARTTALLNGVFSGISNGIQAAFPPDVVSTPARDSISLPK
jgi:hypothetical protein